MINHDKTALISSMNNLINHISSSQQSQQQIFESLEFKDFYKIISNLTDPNKELRITSALLLALLLHNSESLQRQFCLTMNIHFSNNSEIIINNNFDKLIQLFPHKAPQIFKIMKNCNKVGSTFSIKSKSLLWVINPQKSNLVIEQLSKEYIQDLIKNSRFNDNPQETSFDPLFCIFGVSIVSSLESQSKQKSTQNTQLSNSQDFSPKTIQQLQPPLVFPSAYASNSQPSQRSNKPSQMRVTVSKFDNLNKTTHLNTTAKTQRYINEATSEQKLDQGLKKISLTQNKRKRIEQHSKVRFMYEGGTQANQVIRSSGNSNNKYEQLITQSCHIPETYKKVVEQPVCFTPLTIGYNGVGNQSLRNQHMMGSSMRVKNIAMNGRTSWESSNNTINMANSNGYVMY